jgi:8-oxo-dGTP pyrophosphatase MutT (NUDIX family)
MSNLAKEIQSIVSSDISTTSVGNRFLVRAKEGKLTRDENPASHYCVYFLPYNIAAKQIFIVHHKKSGLWLSPGGHIDKGETLVQALNREISEELGIENKIKDSVRPFLLTITPINNPKHPCKEHLDVWYCFQTTVNEFKIDPREFHQTKWVSIEEARNLVTDEPNIEALEGTEKIFLNE